MHTFITGKNHESQKSKGINANVFDDELKYEDYENVSFNGSYMTHEMNRIQSKRHNTGLYRINKVSLSSYRHKKHIPKDGYCRVLYFHKSTL